MAKLTKDSLTRKVKEIAEKNKSTFVTLKQFNRESGISYPLIYSLFPNGWDDVIQSAGLKPSPLRIKLKPKSDDELFSEYHRVVKELRRIPTAYQFESMSDIGERTYRRRFGTKENVLKAYEAWLEVNDPNSPQLLMVQKKVGSGKRSQRVVKVPLTNHEAFVNETRLKEIEEIKSNQYDLKKLIRFCEELNSNFATGNYLSTAILTRAILDYVPPIFGKDDFTKVVASHGGKSFKEIMDRLDKASRKIADYHLHSQIQRKEILPNKTQVNFSNELDLLLSEVVRILK